MKKSLLILIILFYTCQTFANDDFVLLKNFNPQYKLTVDYQICTINHKKSFEPICDPAAQAILNRNETSLKIPIDSWAFDVLISKAIMQDAQGNILSKGEFLGEEDCKGFSQETLIFKINGLQQIECIK